MQFISLIAVIIICCSYFNYVGTYPISSFVSFTNIKSPVNYRWEKRKSAWKSFLTNKYLAKVMHERRRSYRYISSPQKNEESTLSYCFKQCLSRSLKVKKKKKKGGARRNFWRLFGAIKIWTAFLTSEINEINNFDRKFWYQQRKC